MRMMFVLLALTLALVATGASAQSLSPMSNAGFTPSDVKAFRLMVGNPYKTRVVFEAEVMDPTFTSAAPYAAVNAPEFALAPGASRPIIVEFKIVPPYKERTIGVCIWPKVVAGPIQPRVCGLYTGKLYNAGG